MRLPVLLIAAGSLLSGSAASGQSLEANLGGELRSGFMGDISASLSGNIGSAPRIRPSVYDEGVLPAGGPVQTNVGRTLPQDLTGGGARSTLLEQLQSPYGPADLGPFGLRALVRSPSDLTTTTVSSGIGAPPGTNTATTGAGSSTSATGGGFGSGFGGGGGSSSGFGFGFGAGEN